MKIFELIIPKLRYNEFIEEIKGYTMRPVSWDRSQTRLIFTPNPEICLKTLEDEEFLEVLRQADYLTSDGIGLYLGYQINDFFARRITCHPKTPLALWERGWGWGLLPYYTFNILFRKKYLYSLYGDRICWSDITSELVSFAQSEWIKIAIVDPYFPDDVAKCEAQKHFSSRLSEIFPNLKFEYQILRDDNREEIFESLNNSDAEICFATLGMKRQEMFCIDVREKCLNIKLALGVGSSFDYYTWFQRRAPKLWRDTWFEWLYRTFTSPNKLKRLRRIFQALIVFPLKVIIYKSKNL